MSQHLCPTHGLYMTDRDGSSPFASSLHCPKCEAADFPQPDIVLECGVRGWAPQRAGTIGCVPGLYRQETRVTR
jgi:hypothetical protein